MVGRVGQAETTFPSSFEDTLAEHSERERLPDGMRWRRGVAAGHGEDVQSAHCRFASNSRHQYQTVGEEPISKVKNYTKNVTAVIKSQKLFVYMKNKTVTDFSFS